MTHRTPWRLLIAAALLLCLLPAAAALAQEAEPETPPPGAALDEARALLAEGQAAAALAVLRTLPLDSPDRINVLFQTGMAAIAVSGQQGLGEEAQRVLHDEAIAAFQAILVERPELVQELLAEGRAAAALTILRTLPLDGPDRINVLFQTGMAAIAVSGQQGLGEEAQRVLHDEAIAAFQAILVERPELVQELLAEGRAAAALTILRTLPLDGPDRINVPVPDRHGGHGRIRAAGAGRGSAAGAACTRPSPPSGPSWWSAQNWSGAPRTGARLLPEGAGRLGAAALRAGAGQPAAAAGGGQHPALPGRHARAQAPHRLLRRRHRPGQQPELRLTDRDHLSRHGVRAPALPPR